MTHRPAWFRDGQVFVSYAPTVGINKDGEELFVIDSETGTRTEMVDDQIAADASNLVENFTTTETSRWIDIETLTDRLIAVPTYFDERPLKEFDDIMKLPEMEGFTSVTIGELISNGALIAMSGHGSPSADFRTGKVPYIKVSDIRAGQVNINPTNRVTEVIAQKYWGGKESGLQEYDLVTPIRTSKNIGDFAVLMPNQERVVLTKEVLVLRASTLANFDNFYLLWALTLKAVRQQWDRIVFMQTNREDVGRRFHEIRIPLPPDAETAEIVSKPFRDYYVGTQKIREEFLQYLSNDDKHHIFMSSAVDADNEDESEGHSEG